MDKIHFFMVDIRIKHHFTTCLQGKWLQAPNIQFIKTIFEIQPICELEGVHTCLSHPKETVFSN